MKTLEEIKDNYVMDKFLASHELDTWVDFQNYFASRHPEWFEQHNDEILKLYAIEVAKEALNNASEKGNLLRDGSILILPETIKSDKNIPEL